MHRVNSVFAASSCYGNVDQGTMIAKIGEEFYREGYECGKKFYVRCIEGLNTTTCRGDGTNFVTVKIVGLCSSSECPSSSFSISLSKEAFNKIAYPGQRIIRAELEV
ncbi:hypothetical protein RHSIM_Rhsim01G0007700 [Rhododendron simsii]|uniref:Expansin-like EG45 domain-containing protein n=1 Tax=Rhododendron simsii TaxID=118357 RepID=A0A834HH32_RHOSS|nr:hypothetical protein RHSIM_Rhsim01G0007700 [Rhododendron simsii]